MREARFGKRLLALVLTLALLIGVVPSGVLSFKATAATDEPIYVLAGSDFQPTDGKTATGVNLLNGILSQIQKDYPKMDGFLFAGDYDYNYTASTAGKLALQDAVQAIYGTGMHEVYIEGNHDSKYQDLVGSVLSNSGNNDCDDYGVFVINEQDYMWYNKDLSTIQKTASNLDAYLDEKAEAGYTKPVFVVSHLPLHYNMRTLKGGEDGKYANYIFDVLNEGGEKGLNIIFLYGHNHSHGWDDYLGGAAVYLAKGDKINIAQSSTTVYKEETLNFTYMNAGFVSYYGDTGNTADKSLTMTVFEITGSQVIVKRYDSNGVHNLKSAGVYGGEYPDNKYASPVYAEDKTVYASPQYIKLVDNKTYSSNGVSVSAPGIEGVAVSVDKTNPDSEKYSAYITYDITPNKYIQGDVAEVTITLPEDAGFDASRPVVVLDVSQNQTAVKNIVDGKVHFTTQHFSEYAVMQLAVSADTVTNWVEIPGEATVYYQLATSITSGGEYLIASGNSGTVKILNSNGNSTNATVSDGKITASLANSYLWTFTDSGSSYTIRNKDTSKYLFPNASYSWRNERWSYSLTTNGNSSTEVQISNNNGALTISREVSSYFSSTTAYMTNGFGASDSESSVYIFEKKTVSANATFAGMTGTTSYNIANGSYADSAAVINMVKAGLTVQKADDANGTNAVDVTDYTIEGTVNPSTNGTYTLTVKYDGVTLGTVKVTVADKAIKNTALISASGTVIKNSDTYTSTGAQILVTYDDDTTELVDVTVGMLSGTMDVRTVGTYPDLTVTYNGVKVPGTFTLYVVGQNDKPTYPNDGAVRVNKTATGIDFQASGIARVELSTAGVNANKGVDLIIMLDTSSSMGNSVDGTTRMSVLKQSLQNLITQLKMAETTDGDPLDVRMAVADFNGYFTSSSSPYYIDDADHPTGGSIRTNAANPAVFSGTEDLTAGAFVNVHSLTANAFDGDLGTHSGTNYDYGLDAVYQLGAAIKAKNEDDGVERDLFVMFMSDGAPFQYNYFSSQSDGSGADYWNNWLQGTMTDAMFANGSQKHYYNPDGNKSWMAEAIKGDPNQRYNIIRKNDNGLEDVIGEATGDMAGKANAWSVPGLGATMFTIGFCLAVDKDIEVASMTNVLSKMASVHDGRTLYYPATNAAQLQEAFSSIGNAVVYAATNARFVDQLGGAFDLVIKPNTYEVVENGVTVSKTHIPEITVKRYTLYTKADVEAGRATADMVGKRTGAVELLETVIFNDDGSAAYSTHVDKDGDGKYGAIKQGDKYVINDADDNILLSGIICAQTFWYNTTANSVAIEGVAIPQKDGTISNVLPAETFYWKVGTVNETELAISYDVYLTKTMEGERPAGSYSTNNYAILYYTNWQGNDIYQETTSPSVAWKSANVSYAFYLVNADGEIVVDPATGATGSFTNRVQVTVPVVFDEILLNNQDQIRAISVTDVATSILPEGYKLYDAAAEYYISIKSNGTGYWEIIKGNDKVATTYVTGFSSNEYSNVQNESQVGYDYTHTTVWFAVLWIPSTIPDAVVIDFGLPVDIHVLDNDQFGESGQLVGIAPAGSMPTTGANNQGVVYTTTLDGDFKTANVQGKFGVLSIDMVNKTVRYTPSGMVMTEPEVFEYAVYYRLNGGQHNGYYYGKVTIIPATTIYYEDTFVKLEAWNGETQDNSLWQGGGSSGVQAEDRPGYFSPEDIDKDNIYGYDSAYLSTSTHSLGSAAKLTVNADTYGIASFTFYGTGFDVISMTSNMTGTIVVETYRVSDNRLMHSYAVDTFYGYEMSDEDFNGDGENDWVVSPNKPEALYQVPVMKVSGLEYDKYYVEIWVLYDELFDNAKAGKYDFYLDAIRIYDPTGNENENANNVYVQDGEGWPVYEELRNNVISAEGVTVDPETGKVTFPADDAFVKGAIFIDSKDNNNSVADYVNFGPNNELYLMQNQAIAFNVTMTATVDNVHLGIKVGNGGTVTYKINGDEYTVSTTSELYRSITQYAKAGTVVIENVSGGILSLTNIKVTHTEAPGSTASDGLLWIDEAGATFALMSLRSAPPAVDEEPTEPEVTEPEVTEPEVTEPEVTEPEVTEPEVTEPEVTEPETTEPEVTEPEVTEPEVTEPEATEPDAEIPDEPVVEEDPGFWEKLFGAIGGFFRSLFGWIFG